MGTIEDVRNAGGPLIAYSDSLREMTLALKRFHERAVATLLDRIDRKTEFALEALRELSRDGRPDLAMVVFAESDTVGHHYWRDHDPDSPRHDPAAPKSCRARASRARSSGTKSTGCSSFWRRAAPA